MFSASVVDGVVNGSAAPGAGLVNLIAEKAAIACERLDDLRLLVKGHRESLISPPTEDAVEKIDGSFLFEFDAVSNAVGSVQKHANSQREIGLFAEETDFLGGVIIADFKIALIEVGNEFVAAIENSKQNVD